MLPLSGNAYRSVSAPHAARRRLASIAICAASFVSLLVAPARPALAADEFKPFKLKTLAGDQKTLPDVLGSKATLVFFFFPTCKYCNEAFPKVQRIYDTYKDQGLAMVWINAVPREERLIKDWLAKHGYTVPVLVGASIRAIDKDYKVTLTPTHFLLDSKGAIVSTHAGYTAGDETALERQVQQALQ